MQDEVGYLQGSLSCKVLELQSHSKYKSYFNAGLNQIYSKRSSSNSHCQVFKKFYVLETMKLYLFHVLLVKMVHALTWRF
jgi:ASC-1-like (ASCH) protein